MLVGLDVLRRGRNSTARRRLQDANVGLLTHQAAVDGEGLQTILALKNLNITPSIIFSPEHGLDGLAQAEEAVTKDEADVGSIPLISLYGSTKESLTPTPSNLEGLDVLVIDLVDVGSRYYTYVWTALLAARAAARAGIHTMVLDRPNPIGGDPVQLEGRPQDAELLSFVGLESIPIRHCMTLGEILVSLFNQEEESLGRDGALSVVPTEGWERHGLANAFGRPFVPPSPNMPTAETALLYPGGCLLEGTNLSEGRGTTTPFSLVGAPFIDGGKLAQALGTIPGLWLRPTRFQPTFDKHAGKVCGGLMLHVHNERTFRPVAAYLSIINEARRQAPDDFELLSRVYEFEDKHPAFDLLSGTPKARELLQAGADSQELIDLLCPVDEEWTIRVESAEDLLQESRA